MQTFPETNRQHLSHDAALMLLAVLPSYVRDAYESRSTDWFQQIGYSVE